MQDKTEQLAAGPDEQQTSGDGGAGSLAARRNVLKKAAIVPVLMTVQTPSALACFNECVKASAYASLKAGKATLQTSGGPKGSYTCHSYHEWKTRWSPCKDYYFLTRTDGKSCAGFLKPGSSDRCRTAGYKNFPGMDKPWDKVSKWDWNLRRYVVEDGATIGDVLWNGGSNDTERLARHCTALYLTAVHEPQSALYSKSEVLRIWAELKDGGSCAPTGSSQPLSMAEWLEYFDYLMG